VPLTGREAHSNVTMAHRLRLGCIGLALACVVSSAPLAANEASDPSPTELIEGLLSGRAPVGGPFELTDQTGHRRTDADFHGKLVVLYFGYTYCPDVCPTELQSISLALDKLGAAANAVQPVFITVDPERDTPAALKDYLSNFDPHLRGLTGDPAAVEATLKAYRVYAAKIPLKDGDYTMDHTAAVYLMDKDGRFVATFNLKQTPEAAAGQLRGYL
jgi:protein SCO1